MMVMVVPQMSQLFIQSGQELPLPTKILIAVSDFCVKYWPIVIGGFAGLVVGVGAWKKTRTGKYLWDAMMLKLPVFGPIFQKGALSKFSRSFSNMMASGVPIIKSIEIVAHAVGNEVYKRRLLLTAEDMKRGIPMAENMAESKLFPKILVNMIEVGEQTAQLETVVLKVAEFYDEEIDEVVRSLTKIMEPLILAIIGVTVGGLVAAIMLPIIQLTNIAGTG
jgi:type IV pilus assembly protein PilC